MFTTRENRRAATIINKAIEQSKDSLGSAANENEIYRQSVEGLQNELKN